MSRPTRIALNAFLPTLIASTLVTLVDVSHRTFSPIDALPAVLTYAFYGYIFAAFPSMLHTGLMELTYRKFPPAHPLALIVSTINGLLAGAFVGFIVTRDAWSSANTLPFPVLGALTGLILGDVIARGHPRNPTAFERRTA
jgi:hypothetical protein